MEGGGFRDGGFGNGGIGDGGIGGEEGSFHLASKCEKPSGSSKSDNFS